MATFNTTNGEGRFMDDNSREDLIQYILRPDKIKHSYYGGIAVDMQDILGSMNAVAENFNKNTGVRIRHFILSFHPYELSDPENAYKIGMQIIRNIGREYQAVFAVHEDREHLHIHIASNAISHIDGHRYRGTREEFNVLKSFIAKVLRQYGISPLIYIPTKKEI